MANQQVIISVLADVSRFANNMRSLGSSFSRFGKMAALSTAAIGVGLFKLGENLIAVAEESAKADKRLANITDSMGLFGKQASTVTARLQDFADTQSLITSVDDEVIKGAQAKLMTFKNLAKSADEVGGAFDRATLASLDLAAAGFGSAESASVMLGKALQDPVKGITSLTRVGVTFTEQEKKRIAALIESNNLTEAQGVILKAVETQVGGTAAATALASQQIKNSFENISEEIGSVLLPYVAEASAAFAQWLNDKETQKFFEKVKSALDTFIGDFIDAFNQPAVKEAFASLADKGQKFLDWLNSPEGKAAVKDFANDIARSFGAIAKAINKAYDAMTAFKNWVLENQEWLKLWVLGGGSSIPIPERFRTTDPGIPTPNTRSTPGKASSGFVINFNAPVDSVSAGREVARVLADYHRTRGVM